jgi:Zn-dependent peptidase ImmA (M78 family)
MASKTWTEPLVLRLAERTADRDPEQAIESYARSLLEAAEQTDLPVDVDLVASVKGVKRRRGEHDFAGRIYVEDDGQLVMDLNTTHNENRVRFTCAHEMMNTGFPDFEEEQRYRLDTVVESNPVNREEEYLCDLGAAALLMPEELVSDSYRLADGLSEVQRLSSDAEVSLEAAGNRLVGLADEACVFMTFEYGHKPADQPAMRREEFVEKHVRLRYARCAGLDLYLPRFKSADEDSAITEAHRTGKLERGVEALPGSNTGEVFEIEAKCYGADERQRVLAVAVPSR